MPEKALRYQDLVIRDGKFVGQFEEMYHEFEDPWHQSESDHNALSVSRNIALVNMRKLGIGSVVEFGCGLGYYTDFIRRCLGIRVLGVDISPTAISKARTRFPDAQFVVDDVSNLRAYKDFDSILFAEITWYLLDRLQRVFEEMLIHASGKYFVHNLVFYKNDTQKYGREFFTNVEQFIDFCPFRLLSKAEYTSSDPAATIETSTVFRIQPK